MDWLLEHLGGVLRPAGRLPPAAAAAAALSGDLVRLRWMLQRGCDFDARREEYRGEIDPEFSVLPMAMASAGLEVVEWLVREAGCQLPPPAAPAAAAGDAASPQASLVHAQKFLNLVGAAAGSGDAAKLRWLRDRGLLPLHPQLLSYAAQMAATGGRLETLRYLHEQCGLSLSAEVARDVVSSGNLATAHWVLQQGGRELFADSQAVWTSAAGSGSLDMVRWALEQEVVARDQLVRAAYWLVRCWPSEAQRDSELLSAAQLLFEALGSPSGTGAGSSVGVQHGAEGGGGGGGGGDGGGSGGGDGDGGGGGGGGGDGGGGGGGGARLPPPWDSDSAFDFAEQALVFAVQNSSSLPLFTYLHSQLQCSLGPAVLLEAVRRGCEALVEWLLNHGCALADDTLQLFTAPMETGDVFTLRCLRRMGVPWPGALLPEAVRQGCLLPMLQWLVAEGVPVDGEAVVQALNQAPLAYRLEVASRLFSWLVGAEAVREERTGG